jgi:hypothetical protein
MAVEKINNSTEKTNASVWTFSPTDNTVITLQELFTFEYDASNYLYNLPPKQQNLFWAGNFQIPRTDLTGHTFLDPRKPSATAAVPADKDPSPNHDAYYSKFDNAQFRIKSIQFQTPTLEYKHNPVLQTDLISGITIPREVTIVWEEDVYRSVQLYHLNWLKAWYNRDTDQFISGLSFSKIRNLDIVSFQYVNKAIHSTADNTTQTSMTVPFPEPILLISLLGLKPKTFGNFNFDYGNAGNDEGLSLTYAVNKVHISINKELVANGYDMLYKPYASDGDVVVPDELKLRFTEARKMGGLIL